MKRIAAWSLLLGFLACSPWVSAASPPSPEEQEAQALAEDILSGTPQAASSAVQEVRDLLGQRSKGAAGFLRKYWLPALLKARRFDVAEELALQAILENAAQTGDVEALQEVRVRVRLLSGKPKEALAEARRLFNVASMRNTEHSLLLIAECLRSAYPDQKDILDRFRQQQVAGARAEVEPAKEGQAQSVLAAAELSDAPYREAIGKLTEDDDRSATAKGNLLLLAGRATEAKAVFEKLLSQTGAERLLPYHENVARAIKAEDGTIGRANARLRATPEEER